MRSKASSVAYNKPGQFLRYFQTNYEAIRVAEEVSSVKSFDLCQILDSDGFGWPCPLNKSTSCVFLLDKTIFLESKSIRQGFMFIARSIIEFQVPRVIFYTWHEFYYYFYAQAASSHIHHYRHYQPVIAHYQATVSLLVQHQSNANIVQFNWQFL